MGPQGHKRAAWQKYEIFHLTMNCGLGTQSAPALEESFTLILPMNPPALRATTSDENVVLLISNDLRGYFRGNPHPPFGHVLPLPWAKENRGGRSCCRVLAIGQRWIGVGSRVQCANGSEKSLTHLLRCRGDRRAHQFFAGIGGGFSSSGNSSVKVAPFPTPSLCARKVPPISWAASALLCSPKPCPLLRVVNP